MLSPKTKSIASTRSLLFWVISVETFAIGFAILIGVQRGEPLRYFDEGRLITWVSALQLLAVSFLSFRILGIRNLVRRQSAWRSPSAVWALTGVGFLYLTADDLFKIHESFDRRIHSILGMDPTGVTDRIDDLFVALYGLVGIWVLHAYRDELKRYAGMIPFLTWGFVLLSTMVLLDVLTNRNDILSALVNRNLVASLSLWLSVAEDSVKIFAEGSFLMGFYRGLQIARLVNAQEIATDKGQHPSRSAR